MDGSANNEGWINGARQILELDRSSTKQLEVSIHDSGRFNAAYPIARHALTQVSAALLLHDHGHSFAALANGRVAFEHALTAQWIILTEGSEVIIANTVERSQSLVLKGLEPYTTDIPAELRSLLTLPKTEILPPFQSICSRFDRTGLLYTVYRGLTGSVHLSGATIAEHASVDPETERLTLHPHPRSKTPPNDFEMALGWSAVLAKTALERLLLDDTDLLQVAAIAHAARLPHDLTSDDRQPERQPARRE